MMTELDIRATEQCFESQPEDRRVNGPYRLVLLPSEVRAVPWSNSIRRNSAVSVIMMVLRTSTQQYHGVCSLQPPGHCHKKGPQLACQKPQLMRISIK